MSTQMTAQSSTLSIAKTNKEAMKSNALAIRTQFSANKARQGNLSINMEDIEALSNIRMFGSQRHKNLLRQLKHNVETLESHQFLAWARLQITRERQRE